MRRWLDVLNRRPGATEAAIAESERQFVMKFPADYAEFLKLTDGFEGLIGKNAHVRLWDAGELASMNEAYEVRKYAPGLLIFGTDGGDEAYGFDTRKFQWPIVQMPFIGLDWNAAQPMGRSFSTFLERLYETD